MEWCSLFIFLGEKMIFKILFQFLIKAWLVYNVAPIFVVQQGDSVMHV